MLHDVCVYVCVGVGLRESLNGLLNLMFLLFQAKKETGIERAELQDVRLMKRAGETKA